MTVRRRRKKEKEEKREKKRQRQKERKRQRKKERNRKLGVFGRRCRTTSRLLPDRSIKSSSIRNFTVALLSHCFIELRGLGVYNSYLLQILALDDHLDVFLLYTEGTDLYR